MKLLLQSSIPDSADPDIILQSLSNIVAALLARVPYLIMGAIVLVIFVIAGRIAKRVLLTAGKRTLLGVTLADLLSRLVSFVITLLGLFVAAVIIFPTFRPGDLIAGLGITSVAIGFAFKDVLQNFFAGILLLWRRPFIVGDVIRTRDYEGQVEEITVRSTRLRTPDGERAVIPNGQVYTSEILVRTAYESRRLCFTVGVGYKDSIEEAREIIRTVLGRVEGVLKKPEPGVFVAELGVSSVNFDVFFWVESRDTQLLKVKDAVVTGIKLALDEAGIEIPYPHAVLLFHDTTGTREDDIPRSEYLSRRFKPEEPAQSDLVESRQVK